jgi:hypothetical protein
MAGQISLGSFLALGALMVGAIRFPRLATPVMGLGLITLSGTTVVGGLAYCL